MRDVVSRLALARLVATLLLGTTVSLPAGAKDRSAVAGGSGAGDPIARIIASRVTVPPLAPPAARLFNADESVGSIPAGHETARPAGIPAPVPPALTFDGGEPAVPRQAMLGTPPGAGEALPVPPSAASPTTVPPAAGPERTEPAVVTGTPTAVPPAAGPEAEAMASVLTRFAAQAVLGDTPAQAEERRRSREGIAAYYAAHGNALLWIDKDHFSAAARSALTRLDHATEDGLDVGRFAVAMPKGTEPRLLAGADLALSEAVVAYGRQAAGSRVDVAHLGGLIDLRPDVPDADRILTIVLAAAGPGDGLHAFNPQQPGYAALRDKLADLRRSNPPEAQSRIPAGPILKPGMKDARVPLIRARFGLDVASVEPGVPPLVYDTKVAAAVADFQRAHGLPASGLLTPGTVAALSGGNPAKLENAIIANMELWRWMPHAIAADRVEVNIPDYTARVLRDGAVFHETRVVVGQPDKPTPVFAEQMRFVIVNPYWNVPLSIIKNEMMPKLAADPNYFAHHGYEVVERNGTTYVRQPPGEGNALGQIKFMFPNSHSVYLHDTNARSFFARDMRALSHGCVRVEQPFSFAEAVLGRENGWSEARVRKLIGGQERTISLPRPLPILITYFTAFVDPQKGFQLRDDVYGYANRVELALDLRS